MISKVIILRLTEVARKEVYLMTNVINNTEEIEFETEDDEKNGDDVTHLSQRKVYTSQGDLEIESLHGKKGRGMLIVQPDFQRNFVWDSKKSSKLIESALLGIPLPVIYLSEENDCKEYVIDGQQRLTAFFSYIEGNFPEEYPSDNKEFKLTSLKAFPELKGKAFKDLSVELQNKILYYKIRTITFNKESDPNLKFEIFERLNTGSVSLSDQELRNCIYRGTYNKLLRELAQDEDFKHIIGIKNSDRRMRDVELVLRFAAFYHASYLNYKPTMRQFLNNDMKRYQDISERDAVQLRKDFKNSASIIRSLLDNHAFKKYKLGTVDNPDGYWVPKKFNASLYDVLMVLFSGVDKHVFMKNKDLIYEAWITLMTSDQEFIDSIERSTSSIQAVTKRFDKWRLILQRIIGISQKERRLFSKAEKEDLYKKTKMCGLCGQEILSIDDAAVDHIEQYWTGGETELRNAQLTHRYCNWAKPRKK